VTLSVAIIGSGPAGFYTADAIVKKFEDVRVDVLDRLPTPFGLLRAGVAPDHQGSKKIGKVFERTAQRDNVCFIGNVEIGRDLTLAELRDMYDAVVISTGAPRDRPLKVPGADKRNVMGSGAFVGWYNSHPDYANLDVDVDVTSVVVIGVGNVALDCARILALTPEELAASDIAPHAEAKINAAHIKDIHIAGRRGPLEATFTHKEVRELGELARAVPLVARHKIPDNADTCPSAERKGKETNLALLRGYAENTRDMKPIGLWLHFYAQPVEILGGERVEAVKFERTRVDADGNCIGLGEFVEIPAGLVIACIGYQAIPIAGAPFDERRGLIKNQEGRIEPGLYASGWAMRGPTGTIATSAPDAEAVAEHIAEDIPNPGKPGASALLALLEKRDARPVTYEDWQKIDAAEQAAAKDRSSPRRKFVRIGDMLNVVEKS
jgi:NADPH-dependent glutamate synthase beta subunit-like oxidoreductase